MKMANNFIEKGSNIESYYKENFKTYSEYFEAKKRQYSTYEIKKIQNKKFHELMEKIQSVPYYQEIMKKYDLSKFDDISDLSKFPILTKTTLRKEFIKLINKDIDLRNCYRNRTSGSTSQPTVNMHLLEEHQRVHSINVMRQRDAWEIEKYHRMILIIPKRFKIGLKDYPDYVIDMNGVIKVWTITSDEIPNINNILNYVKPDIIYGNPFLLNLAIDELSKTRKKYYCPKVVFSSFELLTVGLREKIRETFNCKICDIYGFSEVGDVAWQCPVTGDYHINDDYYFVETVDDEGKSIEGKPGEIIVTSFHNSAMPLIRYKVGDSGILLPEKEVCKCGRKTRRLKRILGRSVDFIIGKNNRKFSPYDIMTILEKYKVKKFKVIQENIDRCDFFLQGNNVDFGLLEESLNSFFENLIDIRIIQVDTLPNDVNKSEKYKSIQSKISREYQNET